MDVDWKSVKRVLLVRLRSIGDTVLSTPSLIALKRFLPHGQVDILLEDWVAPILDGFDAVDEVLTVRSGIASRIAAAREIRRRKYDVVFNIHGGTTATFFTAVSGAMHRVGYANYQYAFLYNHLLSSPSDFWKREATHSAEQQLALLGFIGVPVDDRPKSRLAITDEANRLLDLKLSGAGSGSIDRGEPFAIIHPIAASKTKEWDLEKFARTAEFLETKGIATIAVGAASEEARLSELVTLSSTPMHTVTSLSLPELTALAARARLFVGNDSGVAHIAAAIKTPIVVIFGSSNRDHWRPWTDSPNEVVFESMPCQPCPGYECKEFGEPRCIQTLGIEKVFTAIDRVLHASS
jgi:ADP-heptose:LPS heptosyltransferase